jgi:ATPase subunit of ABC transporter with duplicated ATPase domains
MTTLEVRELSVEVGGKTVVENLSFTLRAGDKMGVVGRNGAGKTSLLKVLGGEDLPLTGTIARNGAIGYLRQDPRQHRADDHLTGLEHILSARDLVELARRLEKARIQLEESHADKNVARFASLEAGYRSEERRVGKECM